MAMDERLITDGTTDAVIYSTIASILMVLVLIFCVRKRKVKIEEKSRDSLKWSANENHNLCNDSPEEQTIDTKKDNNLSSNEANNESTKSSSLSLNSRLRANDSNLTTKQMTDLRLKINDSMIRSPNMIDCRHDDSDIYDVPPKRLSPSVANSFGANIGTSHPTIGSTDATTPFSHMPPNYQMSTKASATTSHDSHDTNHIYDCPRN